MNFYSVFFDFYNNIYYVGYFSEIAIDTWQILYIISDITPSESLDEIIHFGKSWADLNNHKWKDFNENVTMIPPNIEYQSDDLWIDFLSTIDEYIYTTATLIFESGNLFHATRNKNGIVEWGKNNDKYNKLLFLFSALSQYGTGVIVKSVLPEKHTNDKNIVEVRAWFISSEKKITNIKAMSVFDCFANDETGEMIIPPPEYLYCDISGEKYSPILSITT